ncbi:MAG: hypothetical protein HRU38_15810 [Saccharospirillaceae bacterium]|nr:hypothetical protein [Pseudomonadales bacterium]NRB80107.1 hypothetical protein [Saccharospirillaceae bacterium]
MNTFITVLSHEISKQRFLLFFLPILSTLAFTLLSLFAYYQLTQSFEFNDTNAVSFLHNQGINTIYENMSLDKNLFNWFASQDRVVFLIIYISGFIFFINTFLNEINNKSALFYALLPINPYFNIFIKLLINLVFFPLMIIFSYLLLKIIVLACVTLFSPESLDIHFWSSMCHILMSQLKTAIISILYFITLAPFLLVIYYGTINYNNPFSIIVAFSILFIVLLERLIIGSDFLWNFTYNAILYPFYQLWIKANVNAGEVLTTLYQSIELYISFVLSCLLVVFIQKSLRHKI